MTSPRYSTDVSVPQAIKAMVPGVSHTTAVKQTCAIQMLDVVRTVRDTMFVAVTPALEV